MSNSFCYFDREEALEQYVDAKGKLPVYYAERSLHKFIRDWAAKFNKKRGEGSALEKSIKTLLDLMDDSASTQQQIKDFIVSSKCLDIDTWQACKYYQYDTKGPMGLSFGDVINRCCKNTDNQLVMWICFRIYLNKTCSFWHIRYGHNWEREMLSQDDLVSFCRDRGYND